MKKLVWVSDFFVEELNGGAEACDHSWIQFLQEDHQYQIKKIKSKDVDPNLINSNSVYLFSNFAQMGDEAKFKSIVEKLIENNVQYYILEHDQKFCVQRNVWLHNKNMICECFPRTSHVHMFYFFCQSCFVQTTFHENLFKQNIYCNTVKLGTNLWCKEDYAWMDECKKTATSNGNYIIFQSTYYNKNTNGCIEYAKNNNLSYELLSNLSWKDYIKKLSESEGIIFLPKLAESASRLVFEAKYLGKKVIANKLVGYTWEPWWKEENPDYLFITNLAKKRFIEELEKPIPKVSIFCTTYNSEKLIKGFLEGVANFEFDFEKQIYEVVIYDGGSTDKTKEIIEKFILNNYSCVRPIRFYENEGPNKIGVYKGWNRALSKCKGQFVVNMNADDRFSKIALKDLYDKTLKENDFVYADSYITKNENETFDSFIKIGELKWPEYDKELLKKMCFGGHFPIFRKSLMLKAGLFEESYASAGDWDFWIRLSESGAKFKKLNKFLGLYYFNPEGVSTNQNGASSINAVESQKIKEKYSKPNT